MKIIDLHTHSTCSDGTLSPKQLSLYAAKKGLSAYALTDHDTVDGIEEAKFYAEKNNIEFIPGIEISSGYNNREIHIVGLFIDYKNSTLISRLSHIKEKREKRNEIIVKKLDGLGIKIDYDEILNENKGKIITKAHFAKQLVKKNYSSSIYEALNKYLNEGAPAYVKKEVLPAKETVSLIKSAGGIAVLAHPLYYKLSENELNKMLEDLSPYLTAMECYYSTHSKEDVLYTVSLCERYGLLASGGSDFHGDNKPGLDLAVGYGNLKADYAVLEKLKEAALIGKGFN